MELRVHQLSTTAKTETNFLIQEQWTLNSRETVQSNLWWQPVCLNSMYFHKYLLSIYFWQGPRLWQGPVYYTYRNKQNITIDLKIFITYHVKQVWTHILNIRQIVIHLVLKIQTKCYITQKGVRLMPNKDILEWFIKKLTMEMYLEGWIRFKLIKMTSVNDKKCFQ